MTQKFQGCIGLMLVLAACTSGGEPASNCESDDNDCGGASGSAGGEQGGGEQGGQSEEGGQGGGMAGASAGSNAGGAAGSAGSAGGSAGGLGGTAGAGQAGAGGAAGNAGGAAGAGVLGGAGGGVFVGDPTKPWNFLWVGNSFTFNSNAAGQTKELVNKGQTAITIAKSDLSVNWYRGLYFHWNFGNNVSGGNTLALIRAKTYTHVALQDFMLHPTAKAEINKATGEGTYGVDVAADYQKRFIDEVKKNGQVPIIWAIWPEQDKRSDWEALILAYKKIASDNGAVFVPASASWLFALKERPNLALWDGDRFHPSSMGGYACSCVFYAVLTGKSPVGIPYTNGIDADTAKFLQEKAWQAYQMYGNR